MLNATNNICKQHVKVTTQKTMTYIKHVIYICVFISLRDYILIFHNIS